MYSFRDYAGETMSLSKARRKANAKWNAKHKEKQRYYSAKSTAKRFILKLATVQDLNDIAKLASKRRKALANMQVYKQDKTKTD